jgi:alpha-L-fucosidase
MKKHFFYLLISLVVFQTQVSAQTPKTTDEDDTHLIVNADFETGTLKGWKHWRTRQVTVVKEAYSGNYAVKIGLEKGLCNQEAKVRPNALYRLSAYVKTESGAEEIQLIVSK